MSSAPMLRMLTCGLGLVAALAAGQLHLQAAPPSAPVPTDSQRALLDTYCVTCHNQQLRTAGLLLDRLDVEHVGEGAEIWEKVVRKLRAGQMPPVGRPRPEKAAYDGFAAWIETEIDRAAAARPNPGRPVVRRLNRLEYTNAIRDLLVLEIDGRALLPTDESGYGFDNIGDVLSFSPGLLERYMSAARKISRLAVGDPTRPASVDTYRLSPFLLQEGRASEDLPFGSRGGTVIRHNFPTDGEYVLRIRLGRRFDNDAIQGLAVREQIDVRLDGVRVKLFEVGGECVDSQEQRCELPPGVVPVSEYGRTADEPLHVRFATQGGPRLIGVSFVNRAVGAAEGVGPVRRPTSELRNTEAAPMSVASVEVDGPFNAAGPPDTPSRDRIFVCRPAGAEDETCARQVLGTLARRAYRRAITVRDLEPLLGFYRTGHAAGGFESGIQFALEGLLVSPDFLLRVEHDPSHAAPGSAYRVGDVDLASRLSFFLWSSIPDDELLDLAGAGKLGEPHVLEQQVRRMLADSRASALVTNFASQWLFLRDLRVAAPDTQVFRDFDDSLRAAFQHETELFIESQLRADRSVVELLNADHTFVNERLARFYGIPNVYGTHFRRVKVTDPARRGLLGHGSILTVTSYSNRTSPVQRGKYVLDNLLGSPPPAPPPNVEGLAEAGEGGAPATTVRARMEAHRQNAVCASCHAQMDPIGFALENFDAIGKWRESEFGVPIDAVGALPDGTVLAGPEELRKTLVRRHREFVHTLVEQLLTYALGRGVEYYDGPAIRRIVTNAAPADYRWSSLILGVVDSVPFRMRIAPQREPDVRVDAASDPR